MNINKALEHFKYKWDKKILIPTEKDIEAYNAIIEYREKQDIINLQQNNNLAKLWIHQMILLSNTDMYDGKRCIQVIDEILDKSVYEWCLEMKEQLPMMNFRAAEKRYAGDEELMKAFTFIPKEDDIIKFTADSDAILTRGIVALLLRVFSSQKPKDILAANTDFIDEIGLKEHLSPTRANGLVSMIKKIKMYALAFQAKQ